MQSFKVKHTNFQNALTDRINVCLYEHFSKLFSSPQALGEKKKKQENNNRITTKHIF